MTYAAPRLTLPEAVLTAMHLNVDAPPPLHQLALGHVPVTLHALTVHAQDLGKRKYRFSWAAEQGPQSMVLGSKALTETGRMSRTVPAYRLPLCFGGEGVVEVIARVQPSGEVDISLPGLWAQHLALWPDEVFTRITPAKAISGYGLLPREAVQVQPLPGRYPWSLHVTPGEVPDIALVEGVPVKLYRTDSALGGRFQLGSEVAYISSLDEGRSWLLHTEARSGAVMGMTHEEYTRTVAQCAPRTWPKTNVRLDADTGDLLLIDDPDQSPRIRRFLRLSDERGVRLIAQVCTASGEDAGQRVLSFSAGATFGHCTPESLATLVDPQGQILHVASLVGPADTGVKLNPMDLERQCQNVLREAKKSGDQPGAALALGQAAAALLTRVSAAELGALLPSSFKGAQLTVTPEGFQVSAYGRLTFRVVDGVLQYPGDTQRLTLAEDALSEAVRLCKTPEGHEVFRLLTGLMVLKVRADQALLLPYR